MHSILKNKLLLLVVVLIATMAYAGSQYRSNKGTSRINHVYLSVSNIDSAIAFYLAAFDFKVTNRVSSLKIENGDSTTERPMKLAFLKLPGENLALELSERARTGRSPNIGDQIFHHIGIEVPDITAAYKRVQTAGGKPLGPVQTIRTNSRLEFKQVFFRGLNNELIELCEILSGGY